MHLYSRAVGLGSIKTRAAMDKLINLIVKQAILDDDVIISEREQLGGGYYEAQIDKLMFDEKKVTAGLIIRGTYNPEKKKFKRLFYFPYLESDLIHRCSEINVGRLADKEAYMVHCTEAARDILPIFFLNNIVDYLEEGTFFSADNREVLISALSLEGKIILPVMKTESQLQEIKTVGRNRSQLIDRAMKGDKDAIDSLTISDYDLITNVYRRTQKEDLFSIVDSSFVPSGMECDIYSVVGNIMAVDSEENQITGEKVYFMLLECNETYFTLAINSADLVGMPFKGCRFVGRVWLQGNILPA